MRLPRPMKFSDLLPQEQRVPQRPAPSPTNQLGERVFADYALPQGLTTHRVLADVARATRQTGEAEVVALTRWCAESNVELESTINGWAQARRIRGDAGLAYYGALGIRNTQKAQSLWSRGAELGMRSAVVFCRVIEWTQVTGNADDAVQVALVWVLARRCATSDLPMEVELAAMATVSAESVDDLWVLAGMAFSLTTEDGLFARVRDHATLTGIPIAAVLCEIEDRAAASRVAPATYAEIVLKEAQEQRRKAAAIQAFAASGAVQREEAKALTAQDLEQALADLMALTGLAEAKAAIQRFLALMQVQQARGTGERPALNLVFTGSPGTGKTTVARLVGRILGGAGLLADGHLVEVDKSGLVASYVGQTAPKVTAAFDEAKGGCLFIDEAYGLLDDAGGGFGAEAINTLLKLVEDRRGQQCVILAGYQGEMQKLLQSNPGLQSRFSTMVHFADYSPAELLEITKLAVSKQGLTLASGCEEVLRTFFNRRPAGNGRLVRNLVEQATQEQALRLQPRLVDTTPDELATITPADLQAAISRLGS